MTDDLDRLDALAAAAHKSQRDWAEFANACDPATIRSLVAENKALREAGETVVAVWNSTKDEPPSGREWAIEGPIDRLHAALHPKDGAS